MMEPFIDIATGGSEIPGAVAGFVAVWAVTINGLLLYRYKFALFFKDL
jgi:hypothetical protein